ncbi:hypothetical protein Tco_1076204, partial [Tanacetum coccineum]
DLDEEKVLFLAGGQTNTFDDEVYEGPVQDMAQNEDNIFQADQCDAFDFDVDEAPIAQTINIISYEQYMLDNEDQVVHSDVSSVPNDAVMIITNDIYEQDALCVTSNNTVNASLTAELARYKELAKDEVSTLKQDFKHKENKLLKEFLDMKHLKEKVEDKLYKQDQSCQANHTRVLVHDHEDTSRDKLETTRKQMIEKMKDPECVKKKVKIAPHDYSKENYFATFTPQKQLTPEQIFWSDYLLKMKPKALKERPKLRKQLQLMTGILCLLYLDFSDMHDAYTVAQKHIAELEAENYNLTLKIKKDDHDEMIKHFAKLEVENLNLQLKYQHLKERFGNKKSVTSLDAPAFESVFIIGNLKEQLQGRGNTIRELKEKILRFQKKHSEADPILDFKALDSQNKDLNAKIVEEARVEKPLDSSLASACLYTKHSQELLEYVIVTCPKDFNKRDKKIATAPLNKKKRVTFMEPGETSTNNSQTHVEQQKMKKTNEPMIPSTRVKDATVASGSKPRSNTKKDRTLPAKNDMKKVEAHYRNNKCSVKQKNHVDSSISFKRTMVNSNSTSVCQTCNKFLMSFNHDKCVVRSLKFVKKSPVNKVWRVKQVKQVWRAIGKLFTNVRFQSQPTGRKFTLGEQCPLNRFTESKVVPVKQNLKALVPVKL